jgi:hypothetical protein
MHRMVSARLVLPLATALVLGIAVSEPVRADVIYDVATTTSRVGSVSGTLTGSGTDLTAWDITAINGGNTYSFESGITGNSGSFQDTGAHIQDGTEVFEFMLDNPDSDKFYLLVTGDFTSGLHYAGGDPLYGGLLSGAPGITAITADQNGSTVTDDDVSLTAQGTASVPEPSSLLLLCSGLLGLGGLTARRVRRSRKTRAVAAGSP